MNYLKKFLIVCVQMALTLPAWGGNTEAKDPIINPVPHEVEMSAEETALDVTTGVRLIDRSGKFENYVDFLPAGDKKAVRLTVEFGQKKAAKAGVREVSGAYRLTIDGKGISILGYDERGVFYGLQTLRQIAMSVGFSTGFRPCVR